MLKEFFLNFLGPPSFGINTQDKNAIFQIQLWFYLPPSKSSQENTVIYTVGLSQRKFHSPCPLIELSFQVPGIHDKPQLEKLGFILGELIYDTLKITHFTPNLILSGLKRQFMPDMKNLIITEGAGIKPLWIEVDKNTNIRILHLLPVYQEEVSLIRQVGIWNAYRSFIKQQIDIFKPNRSLLRGADIHPEELKLAREVGIYQPTPDSIQMSREIINWYVHNAPKIPIAKTGEFPLKLKKLKEHYGIENLDGEAMNTGKDNHIPLDIELLWERLYAGYYKYKEGTGLVPDPNFTPEGAVNLKA